MKKSKRGTHVGVILSFVIFVTFLVFLYVILQPSIRTGASDQNLLNDLEENLVSRVSADMTSVSVGIDGSVLDTKTCLKLNGLITKTEISTNIIVKNDSEDTFKSYLIGSTGNFGLLVDREESGTTLLKVRVSEEFPPIMVDPGISNCEDLNEDNGYIIGLVRTDKYIFESKVEDLMSKYRIDYGGTKDTLSVSDQNEFGFSFTYSNGTTIKTNEVNVSTDVFARELPVLYVDKNAGKVSGLIGIRIW